MGNFLNGPQTRSLARSGGSLRNAGAGILENAHQQSKFMMPSFLNFDSFPRRWKNYTSYNAVCGMGMVAYEASSHRPALSGPSG